MAPTAIPGPAIGLVLFPGLTQLDLTGPLQVFSMLPGARTPLLAPSREPVRCEGGLLLTPDLAFPECPDLDVLCMPGGPGIGDALESPAYLGFLADRGRRARYVTSVCTGSLALAAAGLLDGYRATTHWQSLDLLRLFGVEVSEERVVRDRNRITAGGITAGIDFGLVVAAELAGDAVARAIQLQMQYDPAPPFDCGSPARAPAELVAALRARRADLQAERRRRIEALLDRRKAAGSRER